MQSLCSRFLVRFTVFGCQISADVFKNWNTGTPIEYYYYDEVHITKCGHYAHGSFFARLYWGVNSGRGIKKQEGHTGKLGCTIRLTKFRLQNVVPTLMDHGSCSDIIEYSFYYHGSLFALQR